MKSSRILRGKRYNPSTPIDRLLLDINAAQSAQENIPLPQETIKKSPAAIRGESYRGDVQLPLKLQDNVQLQIDQGGDKAGLRLKALDLYAHLRSTAPLSLTPVNYRDRHALLTAYDPPTSLAYLAGLMPSIYASTVHVLDSTKNRLALLSTKEGEEREVWEPDRVVDYGSGTGSGAWAVQEIWGSTVMTGKGKGKARKYIGLDASRSMVELSSSILGALPEPLPSFPNDQFGRIKLQASTHQLPIPSSASALAKLHLAPNSSLPISGKRTIALVAFTLGDLGTKEKRKEVLKAVWESGAEVIVIVDRGTPMGSRIVGEAREQLLTLGRRSLVGEEVEGVGEKATRGNFILAPCPHDGVCPLFDSTRSYCFFAQRVQSPPFLRHTKHTTRGEDDAKFSYVVFKRGARPVTSSSSTLAKSFDALRLDSESADEPSPSQEMENVEEEDRFDPNEVIELADELDWARVVAPPLKRSGHVILEVCASNGELERHTIPKSQGRQPYYDARKAHWGDTFPHAPKNGPMPAPAAREEPVASPSSSPKILTKKAERIGKVKEVREGRRARGREKIGAAGGDRLAEAGGVEEYEMEIDAGGNLVFRE